MKIEIEIPEYTSECGLIPGATPGGMIQIRSYGPTFGVEGDRDGMITLAKCLLAIAYNWDAAPNGAHIHLDPPDILEDDSSSIVVQRLRES